VRGVDDVLVAQRRIRALDFAQHVARVQRAHRVLERDRSFELERHRLEFTGERLLLEGVEVLPGHLQDLLRRVERDPALDRRAAHVLVRRHQIELFSQVALHDLEGVAGGTGLVDDQDPRGAAARAFLELVGPAAVVGHRLAGEGLGIEFRRVGGIGHLRIVDQHNDRLALDVDALEVVPVELGRGDAVAGEDHVGAADGCAVGDVLRPRHNVVGPLERALAAGAGDGERAGVGSRDADQRHLLDIGAVVVARLQAERLEGVLEVLDGELLALRAGGPALEFVSRQRLDSVEQRRRVELRHRRDSGRGRRRCRRGGAGCRPRGLGLRARRGQDEER
jgi:hypothetical protein